MRFNIASICAFASLATPLVTAAWHDKLAYSANSCTAGSIVCGVNGQPATSIALGAMAFCCFMAKDTAQPYRTGEFGDAKVAIQKNWEKTVKNVGAAAVLVKDKAGEYADKTKKNIVNCANNVCKLVSKPKSSILPTRSNNRNYRRDQRRSGYRKMKRSSPGMRVRSGRPMAIDY
ncbi:unnamed protein product [Clonostachys chloroleuca]|uniref:Uncharacterized protein n=1 Tax=Clonostachys chloroleuca TaxID=1926264 RepID=A0AA35QFV1_9HYPO|nr:unnamed protein product [Clonostachys chloroleuca]